MDKIMVSLIIAIVGIIIQVVIALVGLRRGKKIRTQANEILDKAQRKRKAAITILEFAELWRQPMTEDQRLDLIIEWHERLSEARVHIGLSKDDE